jgi:hypothetical protein
MIYSRVNNQNRVSHQMSALPKKLNLQKLQSPAYLPQVRINVITNQKSYNLVSILLIHSLPSQASYLASLAHGSLHFDPLALANQPPLPGFSQERILGSIRVAMPPEYSPNFLVPPSGAG